MGSAAGHETTPGADSPLGRYLLHRFRLVLAAMVGVLAVGTVGYMAMPHYGFVDALYMTAITLSTVGFEEVHRLDTAGRLFTMGLLVLGFATLVYAAATLTEFFGSGEAMARVQAARGRKMRDALHGHVVVVGFGRVGQAVVAGVRALGRPCLVVDLDPAHALAVTAAGAVALTGDATSEAVLAEAGLERAAALVAACDQDQTNLIVTLTARALQPGLRIVSRVNEGQWRDRMVRAGADIAESPYASYGLSLATSAVTPAVLDVHALPALGLSTEEVAVGPGSALAGRTLAEVGAEHPEVFVVGLRREAQLERWHDFAGTVRPGDVLVAVGAPGVLEALAAAAGGPVTTGTAG